MLRRIVALVLHVLDMGAGGPQVSGPAAVVSRWLRAIG